jgi:hypothetical protein
MNPFEFGRLVKLAVDGQVPSAPAAPKPLALNANARKQLANFQGSRPAWNDAEDTPFAQNLLKTHYGKRYPNVDTMSPEDVYTATLNEAMSRPPVARMARTGVTMKSPTPTPFMAAMTAGRPNWKNAIPMRSAPTTAAAPTPAPAPPSQVAYDPNNPHTWGMPTR